MSTNYGYRSTDGTCSFTYLADPSHLNILSFTGSPLGTNSVVTWDFGDGTAGMGTNPTHVFLAAGTYTVCMFETDAFTGVDICHVCLPVYVSQTPICSFSYSAIPGTVNTYDFVGYIMDSTNIASWDFGDGSVGTGNQINHYYANPGTYTVCMLEVDTNPLTDYFVKPVRQSLSEMPPDANFTVVPFGLDAYFIDMSAGYSSATTYSWDFGDGSTSTLRFPTHTYTHPAPIRYA
ncbi:MAG: PKD domain-containing protein [Bacteroidia bacterium]